MRFMRARRRRPSSRGIVGTGRSGRQRQTTLASALESLERRSMLAGDVLDVAAVMWNGEQVNAVRNEYVFRMPQAAAVAGSASRVPAVRAGWSLDDLGSGFFKLTAPGVSETTLTTWAARQGVQSIDVNRVSQASLTPNDPLYGDVNNWAFPRISADQAWESGTGTATTIVAVLDSGVDYNHPDLAANMWRNPNEIAGDGVDNDRNGVIDDIFGFNALTNSGNPMDDFGHGTVVAGLVGAVGNNGVGMSGVNWTSRIMAVKVMDAGGNVSVANEIRGINYVMAQKMAGQNVVVANCSFGRGTFSQPELDALNQLAATGVTIVAAAGNDANNNDQRPVYPANYSIDGLISVAASDRNDALANFSNFGATTVDLAAPGVGILSTRAAQANALYPQYQTANFTVSNNGFTQNQAFVDGTSCSAAIVSGAAALMRSLKPSASVLQVKNAVLGGVDQSVGLRGRVLTGGRLNLQNSVNLILATTGAFPVPTFVQGQNVSFVEGNQGYTLAEFKVRLDRPNDPGKSCSVYYTTQPGGSAFANVDYVATSGFLTFSGSETQKSFFVRIIGDRAGEQREQFAVQILRNQSRGVDPGTPAVQQLNAVILDDDFDTNPTPPGPTNPSLLPVVSVDVKRQTTTGAGGVAPQVPFREGGVGTFVVSLDRTSTKTVSVKYRTSQPALVPVGTAQQNVDYKAVSGTLIFRPGERTKEITVPIIADRVTDPDETFRMVLSEPVNAEFGAVGVVGQAGAVNGVISDVPYSPPPAPGFQITLSFPDTSLTTSQQLIFQEAANRWQQIIVGDLPNVVDPTTGQLIDDVLIVATAPDIDGEGQTLGQADWTDRRAGTRGLPWKGFMEFDTADVASLEADGQLDEVILHEMGHVLGIGTLWTQFNLVRNLGTANPIYVGANALREYRSIFGQPSATSVPVEDQGGPGTADAHWRESVLGNELMTGLLNEGVSNPLSRITVGGLQDLGYQVNYARADAYTKPVALAALQAGGSGSARSRSPVVSRAVTTASQSRPVALVAAPASVESVAGSFRTLSRSMRPKIRTESTPALARSGPAPVVRSPAIAGSYQG